MTILSIELSAEERERIAQRVVELLRAEQAAPAPEYLSVQQTAELLGVHHRTIRRMLTDGRLRRHSTGVGGSARKLIARTDVDALLKGLR